MKFEDWWKTMTTERMPGMAYELAEMAWIAADRSARDECAENGWQPIDTVPMETDVYVWADYYDRPVLSYAFYSQTDMRLGIKTILFFGLAREQQPTHWTSLPVPPPK